MLIDELDTFIVRHDDDASNARVVCEDCGGVICDVEVGDTLRVLVEVARDHDCADVDKPRGREDDLLCGSDDEDD